MIETTEFHYMTPAKSRWMRITLIAAAVHGIAWGLFVVLFPNAVFQWFRATPPLYPQIWQCNGVFIAACGVGYAIASQAPLRYWPIVLVGLIGRTLGPIGFLWMAASAQVPWSFGVMTIVNDLIWILPFALILRATFIEWRLDDSRRVYEEAAQVLLDTLQTNSGETLAAMSRRAPVLMAFLRHTGCPFCREAAADLAQERAMFESLGVQLALVHMSDDRLGEKFFESYGLADVARIADPDRTLYRAFKLHRGSLRQLFGLRVWQRAVSAALRGHWPGSLQGDSFQLPGLFLIRNGEVMRTFRYETAADRPDYAEFVCGLTANADGFTAVCA